jgi:hypothetical protein
MTAEQRDADDEHRAGAPQRKTLTGPVAPAAGPYGDGDLHRDRDQARQRGDRESAGRLRRRDGQSAVAQERNRKNADGVARSGQRRDDSEVPEQHEEQHRDIADDLHIGAGQRRQQPVAGQPRDADGEAEDRGGHDRDQRDRHGVDDTGPQQRQDARLRRIVGQQERDLDPGGATKEVEPGRDARRGHVVGRVAHEERDRACNRRKHDDLPEDVADPAIVDEGGQHAHTRRVPPGAELAAAGRRPITGKEA